MRGPSGVGKGPGGIKGLAVRLKDEQATERRRAREAARAVAADRPMWRRGPARRLAADPFEQLAYQGFGSLPERVLENWLRRRGFQYERDVPELGGMVTGGAIIDFLIFGLGAEPVVIRVQGRWIHRNRQLTDLHQRVRLQLRGYRVVDLWDDELLAAARGDRLGEYVLAQVQTQG